MLLVGFCGICVLTLVELRRDSWTNAMTGARNLLTVLSQDIESNIRAYDRALTAVQQKLADPRIDELTPELQERFLFSSTLIEPYFVGLFVMNAEGEIMHDAGSVGPQAQNFSDRAYFQVHQNGQASGLYISTPFEPRRHVADTVIALSRRIDAQDGSFDGIVVGIVRLAYFHELFQTAQLKPDDSINLFTAGGVMLMRSPYLESQVGRDMSASENVRRFQAAPSGEFSGIAAVDGVARVYNFVHVGDLPLILNVALSQEGIFAPWRAQAVRIGAVLLLLCVLAVTLAVFIHREFARRRRAEATMRRSEAQYRLLADNATDVIIRLDRDLVRRYVSPASLHVLGLAPEELVGKRTKETIHPDDWPLLESVVQGVRDSGTQAEAIYRLRHRDGSFVWVEGRYNFVAEDQGFIVVLRDITKRKSAEIRLAAAHAELATLANTDGLTGLANRRRFDEALHAEHERAMRDGALLSLLLIDVDRFKRFNDRYGHQAGDECLRRVARAIESCLRPGDLCARYGGEEVAVLLPGVDEAAGARIAERIRRAVELLDIPHEGNEASGGRVTISIGCATFDPARAPADGEDAALVAEADRLLYEAKRTGRNRVVSQGSIGSGPGIPIPEREEERLATVDAYREAARAVPSESLDLVARRAAQLLDAPVGFVSLVGADDVTLIGRHGLDAESVPREVAFCVHTICGQEPLVVADARDDPRFRGSPIARGEGGMRFYAGAPLLDPQTGQAIGAVCVSDVQPRKPLLPSQRDILKDLSGQVVKQMKR